MRVPTSFEEPSEGLPVGQQAEQRLQEGERTGEGRARGVGPGRKALRYPEERWGGMGRAGGWGWIQGHLGGESDELRDLRT